MDSSENVSESTRNDQVQFPLVVVRARSIASGEILERMPRPSLGPVFSLSIQSVAMNVSTCQARCTSSSKLLRILRHPISLSILEPNSSHESQHRRTGLDRWIAFVSRRDAAPSYSSTVYFTCLLWLFAGLKIDAFYVYLVPVGVFAIVYKLIKYILIAIHAYILQQASITSTAQRIATFCNVR